MSYSERNLCITKRAKVPGPLVRQWCEIGYRMEYPPSWGRTWAWDHRWADGHCRNCHKTVDEVLVPEAEKRRATLAMEERGLFEK